MKKRFFSYLVAFCLSLAVFGCGSDDDTSCNISTPNYLTVNAGVVTYAATITGSSAINSITYQTSTGQVSVNNPVVPFLINVPVTAATNISITVQGTARNGEIRGSHAFAGANGEVDQDAVQCGN